MRFPVFFVIGSLNLGGTERHLLQILPHISARGYVVTVLTLGPKGSLASQLEAQGISVVELGWPWLWDGLPHSLRRWVLLPVSMFNLIRAFAGAKPKIVHFFLPQAYLIGGVASLFTGLAFRIMSRRSLNAYQQKYRLLAWLERKLHSRMDYVLGNSKAVTDELRGEGVDQSRLRLVYNGIESMPHVDPAQIAHTRQALGVDAECLVLVCVANLLPYKGHEDLLSALAGIKEQLGANWRLFLVGRDDGIWASLLKFSDANGLSSHIDWLGVRGDVADLYAASNIGILCSHEEGFSNSVLEGMASGIPMVVTRVGGNAEAVVDQESGIVVPPRAPHELGRAILRLAQDKALRFRLGGAAKSRVAELFTVQACVDSYVGLYDELTRRAAAEH